MTEKTSSARRFVWADGYVGCTAVLSAVLGLIIGFGFGILYTEQRGYQQRYLEEREQIEPILASDPAFKKVWCSRRSNGGVALDGTVPTQVDHDRLRERIVRAVGENRTKEIVLSVMVFREERP